jgi:hypothetical protein
MKLSRARAGAFSTLESERSPQPAFLLVV